jgi:hypothetical protein
VAEDPGQLGGHPLDLVLCELQPRELRDVEHLLTLDHGNRW